MVLIKVDTREPMLASLLGDRCKSQENPIRMVVEQLDVGDVHIVFEDGVEEEKKEYNILFERKSCHDMASSIKDGRYREQKMRLIASGAMKHHILYMVEGAPSMTELLDAEETIFGVRPSVLSGMMVNTMLRDGLHVVPVTNTEETAAWVWAIAQRCLTDPGKMVGGAVSASSEYIHQVSVKKRENVTPENCYIMQLCQVPGISTKIAKGITEKFPTMLGLLQGLTAMKDEKAQIQCLSEIPMIGKKKAQQLLSYLLPSS